MARITINGISIDPITQSHALTMAGLASVDASKSNYILIQTKAPLTAEQKKQLSDMGVVIHQYVSENTYECGFKPSDLEAIRRLPFVAWANVYLHGFKVAPNLRGKAGDPSAHILPMAVAAPHSKELHTVDIVFHEDVDPKSEPIREQVAQAARLDKDSLVSSRGKIRATVQERYLDDLAALDEVRVIQEVPTVKLRNSVARGILAADVVLNGTAFQGEGQVVAVADTGFDRGNANNTHPAFTGRVVKLYALGRPNKTNDTDGHGTHVCGSVLGNGNSALMGGAIQGTAPKAQLVLQSLLDGQGGLGGIPTDLHDLFDPPYSNEKARVHTNSWGATQPGLPYDQSAQEIDDYVWNHPDLVICFAAGNEGIDGDGDGVVDPAQIGSEAAAKNCITVGACESLRPNVQASRPTYGSLRPSDFPTALIHDDPVADNPNGMAAFSSRGPTQERRFKPDIVAPGTSILSSHSRDAPAAQDIFGRSSDPLYFFDSGTSMATPLVAGCVAVLRETLVKNGTPNPSAALVKALLINGAVELVGQYSPSEAGPSFNISSGFGRVNLLGSVIVPDSRPNAGFGEGGPLDEEQANEFTIDIPAQPPGTDGAANAGTAGRASLKITLVWSDPPGATLQNDLDLIVQAADGTERHGNMGNAEGFDRTNNVEQVVWPSMPPGQAKIIVRAARITRFAQPYSYAWRIS
jgi:subtilisin family serine protease